MRAHQPKDEPRSLFARLELAMATHHALDEEPSPPTRQHWDPPAAPFASTKKARFTAPALLQTEVEDRHDTINVTNQANETSSVATLADQLQRLLRQKTNHDKIHDGQASDADESEPPPSSHRALALQRALAKIGSNEKDELLVHLLQQATSYRAQLSEVATLGETIAGQLVHQQHELRSKHREQLERLQQELHNAVHAHPRVAVLEAKVDELEEKNREKDERLRFAVLKLQRSRQREKELKLLHDPLWDL